MEKAGELPEKSIELAWDAAYESKDAHFRLEAALDEQLAYITEHNGNLNRDDEYIKRSDYVINRTRAEFEGLSSLAGYFSLMEDSPFAQGNYSVKQPEMPEPRQETEREREIRLNKVISFDIGVKGKQYKNALKVGEFGKLPEDLKLLMAVGQVNRKKYSDIYKTNGEKQEFIRTMIGKGKHDLQIPVDSEELKVLIDKATEEGELRWWGARLVLTEIGFERIEHEA